MADSTLFSSRRSRERIAPRLNRLMELKWSLGSWKRRRLSRVVERPARTATRGRLAVFSCRAARVRISLGRRFCASSTRMRRGRFHFRPGWSLARSSMAASGSFQHGDDGEVAPRRRKTAAEDTLAVGPVRGERIESDLGVGARFPLAGTRQNMRIALEKRKSRSGEELAGRNGPPAARGGGHGRRSPPRSRGICGFQSGDAAERAAHELALENSRKARKRWRMSRARNFRPDPTLGTGQGTIGRDTPAITQEVGPETAARLAERQFGQPYRTATLAAARNTAGSRRTLRAQSPVTLHPAGSSGAPSHSR